MAKLDPPVARQIRDAVIAYAQTGTGVLVHRNPYSPNGRFSCVRRSGFCDGFARSQELSMTFTMRASLGRLVGDTRLPSSCSECSRNPGCSRLVLRGALQLDDGQKPRLVGEGDDEFELRARPHPRRGLRRSAPRRPRPSRPGLVAGSSVRGSRTFVDLGRRATAEAGVRPVLVIPVDVSGHRLAKPVATERDLDAPEPLGLQRPEEPLDRRARTDGVLARVPGLDVVALAP